MTEGRKRQPWWVIPVFIGLLPLVLAAVLLWVLYSVALYLLVWVTWVPRGRDILFVYSDSPHWKAYIEEEILPRIGNRAVILNWSERRNWLGSFGLAAMLFRSFGGYKEFNPIGIHFRLFRRHRVYRFWEPIRRWRKQNEKRELEELLTRFYSDIGV